MATIITPGALPAPSNIAGSTVTGYGTAITGGTTGNVASLSLGPGTWMVAGSEQNSTALTAGEPTFLNSASAVGSNTWPSQSLFGSNGPGTVLSLVVLTVTTTVYLNVSPSATDTYAGSIVAMKILP